MDELIAIFRILNDEVEVISATALPRQYLIAGEPLTVPDYTGVVIPTERRSFFNMEPEPLTGGAAMKATILFEGNGGGWSESMVRYYPNPEADNYLAMAQLLSFYIPERRKALSSTNTAVGCRISQLGVRGDSERKIGATIGLGAGLVTGAPATLDQGMQYIIYDTSRQVVSKMSFGGWAASSLRQETTTARDRNLTSAEINAFLNVLRDVYTKDPDGNYVHPGTPCIESYDRDAGTNQEHTVMGWATAADGYLVLQLEVDPNYARGDKVLLHVPRNKYVQGQGGRYNVLSSSQGATWWEVKIDAHPCIPTAYMSAVLGTVRKDTPAFYPTDKVDIGLFVRRTNGSEFFERRGRQSRRC